MVGSDPNNAAPNVCHGNDYWKSCGVRRISRWYLPSLIRACQWVGIVIMAPSNEKKICIAGPLWGESTGTGGFPSQRQVTQNFEVFFYSRLKKRLSKQSGRRWSEAILCVVGEPGQHGRHQAIIWTNAELYDYCQLDPNQHISMKFYLKFKYFNFTKCIWTRTCRLWNDGHFVGGKWRHVAPPWCLHIRGSRLIIFYIISPYHFIHFNPGYLYMIVIRCWWVYCWQNTNIRNNPSRMHKDSQETTTG